MTYKKFTDKVKENDSNVSIKGINSLITRNTLVLFLLIGNIGFLCSIYVSSLLSLLTGGIGGFLFFCMLDYMSYSKENYFKIEKLSNKCWLLCTILLSALLVLQKILLQ